VNFARQVVVAIGALALWAFGLVGYTLLQPQPDSTAPAAAGDTSALVQSATPTSAAFQVKQPSPADIPDVLGPGQERPTAKKMAQLGGYLNEFWAQQFATDTAFKNKQWKPITELYVDSDIETCGQGANKRVGDYFCPGRYYISLDIAPWEANGVPEVTTARDFIVAHEWGHAVQESADIELRDKDMELQADCFGGSFLRYASDKHLLSDADLDLSTLHATARSIGDDISTPIPGSEHGTGEQRMESFDKGWMMSAAACLL